MRDARTDCVWHAFLRINRKKRIVAGTRRCRTIVSRKAKEWQPLTLEVLRHDDRRADGTCTENAESTDGSSLLNSSKPQHGRFLSTQRDGLMG